MVTRQVGVPSGELAADVAALYDYMSLLVEQINYMQQQTERRIKVLEERSESE